MAGGRVFGLGVLARRRLAYALTGVALFGLVGIAAAQGQRPLRPGRTALSSPGGTEGP
ncbi:MAG TPA: hypothetical protein VE733_08390 [Streptosporangiaceae bacterium]|nr:hypothetical protein [Streptosporangiaceae bacterium]